MCVLTHTCVTISTELPSEKDIAPRAHTFTFLGKHGPKIANLSSRHYANSPLSATPQLTCLFLFSLIYIPANWELHGPNASGGGGRSVPRESSATVIAMYASPRITDIAPVTMAVPWPGLRPPVDSSGAASRAGGGD
jgi:hypothetical protein